MSAETARLLEAYQALPPEDKQTFVREIFRHLPPIDLRERGIDETQPANLRARLKTFADDWDRPEAAIYDENPAR